MKVTVGHLHQWHVVENGMYDNQFSINTCAVEFPEHYSPKTLPVDIKRKVIGDVTEFMQQDLPEDMKQACDDIISSLQYTKVGDII